MENAGRPATGRVVAALLALYIIWGTTYFGIKEAVAVMPPLVMAAIRFLVPAAALFLVAAARGAGRPTLAMWGRAAVLGILMLSIGNGFVSLAETGIPSGVVALIVATVPLWVAAFEWLLEHRRPSIYVVAGIVLGLAGVALLASEKSGWKVGMQWWWAPVLVLSSGCWGLGSILSRRPWPKPDDVWLDLAMQMAAGGVALAIGAGVHGEFSAFDPASVPISAWLWVAYLSVFGSVVALGCYLWLLRTTSPALATTYAFVNPAVAVGVGAWWGSEPTGTWTVVAAGIIIAAVALIVWSKARKAKTLAPG